MNYVLVYKLFQTFSPQMKPDIHKIITDRKGVIFSEVSASKGGEVCLHLKGDLPNRPPVMVSSGGYCRGQYASYSNAFLLNFI